MNTKQLTYPTIEEQQDYWINKEAQSNNATPETREAKCCVCKTTKNLIFVLDDYICRKPDRQAESQKGINPTEYK